MSTSNVRCLLLDILLFMYFLITFMFKNRNILRLISFIALYFEHCILYNITKVKIDL